MRRLWIALVFALCAQDASAWRALGGPPGEETQASAAASCNTSNIGLYAAIKDSNAFRAGDTITGTGPYHVGAYCGPGGVVSVADGIGVSTGALNVRSIGMQPGGFDNGTLVATLNAVIAPIIAQGSSGNAIEFPAYKDYTPTLYYFLSPLELYRNVKMVCGPGVMLVFAPGVPGLILDNSSNAPDGSKGMSQGVVDGCSVISLGVSAGSGGWTTGSTTMPWSSWALPGTINNGVGTTILEPGPAVDDGIITFGGATNWLVPGTVVAGSKTLTLTGSPTQTGSGSPLTTDSAPMLGGLLWDLTNTGNTVPGTFVSAMTGQTAGQTYTTTLPSALSYSTTFRLYQQTPWPSTPMGTYVTACATYQSGSPPVSNRCALRSGSLTYTLSNAFTNGSTGQAWLLPGRNAVNPQNFTATVSATGHIYPITAGISGSTLGVSSSGAGNVLNLGQRVIGVGGNNVSATIGGPTLYVGQFSFPVSTCTGVNSGAYAVATASGNNVFQPGTTVNYCDAAAIGTLGAITGGSGYANGTYNYVPLTGGTGSGAKAQIVVSGGAVSSVTMQVYGKGYAVSDALSASGIGAGSGFSVPVSAVAPAVTLNLTQYQNGNGAGQVTSGSAVVQSFFVYYLNPWSMPVGTPVTDSAGLFAAGTTTTGYGAPSPGKPGYYDLTLSNLASGSSTLDVFYFGGALYAAPNGTTINFLNGRAIITSTGSCTGNCGAQNYTLDGSYTLGSQNIYAYDGADTIYITASPANRRPMPQDFLWLPGFPWGAIAQRIYYGANPGTQTTVLVSQSVDTNQLYFVAGTQNLINDPHMWTLPAGGQKTATADFRNMSIGGFPIGVNMPCLPITVPSGGCGFNTDYNNYVTYAIAGRFVAGNNSSASLSIGEKYDHNYYCDLCDWGSVPSTYIDARLQSRDESSTISDIVGCGSAFISNYLSGSSMEASCPFVGDGMLGARGQYGSEWLNIAYPTYEQPVNSGPLMKRAQIGTLMGGTDPMTDLVGKASFSAGTYTYTFNYKGYTRTPVCACWDTTTPSNSCTATEALTSVTFTGTGTDGFKYHCIGTR